MNTLRIVRLTALLLPASVVPALATGCSSYRTTLVRFTTELGDIDIRIEDERAPVTSANFLLYVDEHIYDGGRFHRAVRLDNQNRSDILIEVVQADVSRDRRRDGHEPIALERTSVTGLLHGDGTISMARGGPDTATSSFFICIGGQPSLDFGGKRNADEQGFAAFGRVIHGMDVVRRIQQSKTRNETLTPPIVIRTARRIDRK